jgi:ribosomal protein S18 acetylase RimI-like enzyme
MEIRKATLRDFEALKEIKSEFFLWECTQNKRFDPCYLKKGLCIRLAKNLRQSNTVFFIADDKLQVIGFAGAEIKKNETCVRPVNQGHLFSLYIRPNYRRKGIAKKLLDEIFKWFKERKIDDLVLETWVQNTAAQSLYKKYGYKPDAISMVRTTSP